MVPLARIENYIMFCPWIKWVWCGSIINFSAWFTSYQDILHCYYNHTWPKNIILRYYLPAYIIIQIVKIELNTNCLYSWMKSTFFYFSECSVIFLKFFCMYDTYVWECESVHVCEGRCTPTMAHRWRSEKVIRHQHCLLSWDKVFHCLSLHIPH